MKKISVIGAGNVGREVAAWCAVKELGDIVLWNRTKERALGNALDLMEAGPVVGFDTKIIVPYLKEYTILKNSIEKDQRRA